MRRTVLSIMGALFLSVGAAAAEDLQLLPGWSATVYAPAVGPARHMVVTSDGTVYVRLREAAGGGGVVALRDEDGDGVADREERFDPTGGTGIALWSGYLYLSSDEAVYRYHLTEGQMTPTGAPEIIVSGFPAQRSHATKQLAIDNGGNHNVTVGAPSNACQARDR